MPKFLKIRKAQIEAFSAALTERFICDGIALVEEQFPKEFARLGEGAVRESVEAAISRGKRYGITRERHVLGLLAAMHACGHDFDTRHPWAKAILNNDLKDASLRVIELEAAIEKHLAS